MADKKLKIIFSGISTLFPGPPRTEDEKPEKAFVMMAANKNAIENDWKATVEPHSPFVFVPKSVLVDPIPKPFGRVRDKKLGICYIYLLDNARVTLYPRPEEKLHYFIDKDHGLGERPGSDDVADERDMRWLADIRDLVPPIEACPSSDPSAPGPEVAVIVDLTGGTLEAGFPCKSVQAQTFKAANAEKDFGIRRVLASEFSIDIAYPKTTRQVTLRLSPLPAHDAPTGIDGNELALRWPMKGGPLVVRMGNDTNREARLATSYRRCDARVRTVAGRPVVRPRDDDFYLHYQLLSVPAKGLRPLPQAGPHQTSGDGCKPAGTGG